MRKAWKVWLVAVLLGAALAGCGGGDGGSSSAGPQTRAVLVDYRHDETETSLFDYFPKNVKVRPGDTVEFEQAWTGEPHSVTFGRIVEPGLRPIVDLIKGVERTGEFPKGEPEEFAAFEALKIPFALDEDEQGNVITVQNAAQPCYVTDATAWPGDATTPCPRTPQPAFTGREAIYSSGLIPYEGVQGNSFEMAIAEDAQPGTYSYFCNVHGPTQFGEIEIAEKGAEIPSAREVAREARRDAEERTEPMVKNHRAAKEGKRVIGGFPGEDIELDTKGKRLIGVPAPFFTDGKISHGIVNEFVPKDDRAKVGEKVTWTFSGYHTISFNVPKYFPVFTIAPDGRVEYNPKAGEPAGWPGPPEQEEGPPGGGEGEGGPPGGGEGEGGPPEGEGGPPEGEGGGPPPKEEPVRIDAGEWDGKGFRSTGLGFPEGAEFSVTFTKAGTYPFACLIHPSMVGKIVVK